MTIITKTCTTHRSREDSSATHHENPLRNRKEARSYYLVVRNNQASVQYSCTVFFLVPNGFDVVRTAVSFVVEVHHVVLRTANYR